jgi:ligand-binding sensor domain-containing protein
MLLFAAIPMLAANGTAMALVWKATAAAVVSKPAKAAPDEQYMRRIWRIQDGLPEDTVQTIQQSTDGYLWIGTTGGLVRSMDRTSISMITPLPRHWSITASFASLSRAMAAYGSVPTAAAWCISRMAPFARIPKLLV